jgi:hypothetical protein
MDQNGPSVGGQDFEDLHSKEGDITSLAACLLHVAGTGGLLLHFIPGIIIRCCIVAWDIYSIMSEGLSE